jgi:hypothetical protein
MVPTRARRESSPPSSCKTAEELLEAYAALTCGLTPIPVTTEPGRKMVEILCFGAAPLLRLKKTWKGKVFYFPLGMKTKTFHQKVYWLFEVMAGENGIANFQCCKYDDPNLVGIQEENPTAAFNSLQAVLKSPTDGRLMCGMFSDVVQDAIRLHFAVDGTPKRQKMDSSDPSSDDDADAFDDRSFDTRRRRLASPKAVSPKPVSPSVVMKKLESSGDLVDRVYSSGIGSQGERVDEAAESKTFDQSFFKSGPVSADGCKEIVRFSSSLLNDIDAVEILYYDKIDPFSDCADAGKAIDLEPIELELPDKQVPYTDPAGDDIVEDHELESLSAAFDVSYGIHGKISQL